MSGLEFKRAQRVGQLIQQELAALLIEGLKDPRVGFVTVTEVRLSDDLKNAKVFVSIYGTDEARAASLEGLRDAAGFLKREVGQRLKLRYTPTLSFHHDDSLDRATRLETLFEAIHEGQTNPPAPDAGEAVPVDTSRSDIEASRKALEAVPPPKPPERRGRRKKHHNRSY